jgi:hypothetical protein
MENKKVAYLILTHNDPTHLERMINALNYNCDIYVHVDKKVNISQFKELFKRCTFIENRVNIAWADISMIDAQMELIRAALITKELYTHLVFLSGSCYPIIKSKKLYEMFANNHTKEFINFIDMRESPSKYMKHINRKWFFKPFISSDIKLVKLIDKSMRKLCRLANFKNYWDSSILPYFGSQWCALTPHCAKYVLNFHDENMWFRDMNKDTMSPDEHYIHTIVGNSEYCGASGGVQQFEGNGTWRLANLHLVDATLSKWFNIEDWGKVRKCKRSFIRKVRTVDGSDLINRIDKEILEIDKYGNH